MDNPTYRIRLMNSWLWQEHRELFTGLRLGETLLTEVEPGSLSVDKC